MTSLADVDTRQVPTPCTDVYFFCTCLVDLFVPQAGLDAVSLLERAGVRVHFPEDQTCCGQPAYTSGQPDEARAVARQQLGLFPEPWPIVLPSGSCTGMMRHHYEKLFEGTADAPVARDVASRVWELSEFLVSVLGVRLNDGGPATTVALHTSCSARRETGALDATRSLLGQLDQVTLKVQDHESECCGFGGMFSVRHPEISGGIVRDKVAAISSCGADVLITGDCGCMLNITGHAQKIGCAMNGKHLASFLLERNLGLKRETKSMTHKTTETGTARELILQRLRQAQPAPMSMPDVSALYGQQLHDDHMTRVERLVLNLTNAMAQVHRTTWAALPKSLADVVRDQQLVSVALGPELLDDAAVCAALGTTTHVLPVTTVHGEQAALFNEVAAGVTLSRAAIAETGTVVLWSGPQSPRLLSLVPPVHIVIVDAHTVYDTLSEVMHAERWSDGLPTNVILVSSPSKTADIQQTLAYGAHGPKQLIVMLVEDVR